LLAALELVVRIERFQLANYVFQCLHTSMRGLRCQATYLSCQKGRKIPLPDLEIGELPGVAVKKTIGLRRQFRLLQRI
jgi:hypothetical protein